MVGTKIHCVWQSALLCSSSYEHCMSISGSTESIATAILHHAKCRALVFGVGDRTSFSYPRYMWLVNCIELSKCEIVFRMWHLNCNTKLSHFLTFRSARPQVTTAGYESEYPCLGSERRKSHTHQIPRVGSFSKVQGKCKLFLGSLVYKSRFAIPGGLSN